MNTWHEPGTIILNDNWKIIVILAGIQRIITVIIIIIIFYNFIQTNHILALISQFKGGTKFWKGETLRESHAVILRDRVVPASQVPFPGEPSGEPGNGTWRAGTTLYRRNDSVGFFFSPVTIKLLQIIRTKTSFHQVCIHFIRIYRLLWSSARVRNELLTNHRRDIKTQGEGRWTRQGCLMWSDIYSLSHYKIKEIARVRKRCLFAPPPPLGVFSQKVTKRRW